MLIGVDMKKDTAILEAAYNDCTKVSSHFNLNLLRRMRRELDAGLNLDGFCHYATYEPKPGRMAIGIQSLYDQTITIGGNRHWFGKGERLHTQHVYKFTVVEFQDLVRSIGFTPVHAFVDKEELFSVHFLSA